MNIEIDGKKLIRSDRLILKSEGTVTFNFEEEKARITLKFIYDKNKNNGHRRIATEVDNDGQGMTILCYNFHLQNPIEEGLIGDPAYIFENDGKKFYLNFKSTLFNSSTRTLDINLLKDI